MIEPIRLIIRLVDVSGPGEVGGEQDSAATSKLEALGYNAGFRLIERLAKDYPKFKDELDLLKFICKDFWVAVFRCSCFLGPPRLFPHQEANRQPSHKSPGRLRSSR